MHAHLTALLRRFWRDESGLSAVEFALVIPVMLASLLGTSEISNALVADRKVTQVVSTIADLTSQDTSITNAEMESIFDCGRAIMLPLNVSTLQMRLTSVVADANGVARVAWSSGRGMSPRAANSVVTIPAGMLTPGASVILAEITYSFASPLGQFILGSVSMSDRFYLRPRRSLTIERIA